MKLRPLPEIDLARIAPQPTEMKWSMLRSFKTGGGSWSYQPAREQVFNIFNPANPMGLRLREPSLAQIESQIDSVRDKSSPTPSCGRSEAHVTSRA